ncbi:MAG TPA: BON domain-containing protein [Burkholderiales bacterium]|nr:BON domain-containing protein [Burkholderiales bacterium]
MRINRKFLIAAATLAAVSVPLAGCDNRQDDAYSPSASTTAGTDLNDTLVTTKVKTALLADSDIKGLDVKVETRKGVVQLSGFVDNQTQIDRAVAATRDVEGVRSVENNISLISGSTTVGGKVEDSMITAKVKAGLLADSDVKSFDIAVATHQGEVQLSGFVDNQHQIDQAIAIANKVSGVTQVDNEMSIKN